MSQFNRVVTGLMVVIALAFFGTANAHKPLLAVEDNMDGTIYIEGAFSDGSSAAGHKIVLEEKGSGKTISEHRVGEDGTLEVNKPSVEYIVTLDAGEGHTVTQDGPPPDKGPEKAEKSEEPAAEAPEKTETEEASTAQVQQKPDKPTAQKRPSAQPPAAQPTVVAQQDFGPGQIMALKMLMITQIVTSVALIVILTIIAYYIGYTMGRKSDGVIVRKEV